MLLLGLLATLALVAVGWASVQSWQTSKKHHRMAAQLAASQTAHALSTALLPEHTQLRAAPEQEQDQEQDRRPIANLLRAQLPPRTTDSLADKASAGLPLFLTIEDTRVPLSDTAGELALDAKPLASAAVALPVAETLRIEAFSAHTGLAPGLAVMLLATLALTATTLALVRTLVRLVRRQDQLSEQGHAIWMTSNAVWRRYSTPFPKASSWRPRREASNSSIAWWQPCLV